MLYRCFVVLLLLQDVLAHGACLDLDECRPELVVNTSNRLVFQLSSAAQDQILLKVQDRSEMLKLVLLVLSIDRLHEVSGLIHTMCLSPISSY